MELKCYGLEVISSITAPPTKASYSDMCEKFGVQLSEVRRPNKIDLLISMWDNQLHPIKTKKTGKITLYQGPLGKYFRDR